MAINLGAMIQSARTQKNTFGDIIANAQNQQDRNRSEDQRHFNNFSSLLGMILGSQGGLGGASAGGSGIGLQEALKQAGIGGGMMAL